MVANGGYQFDPGLHRPYIDSQNHRCVTLNTRKTTAKGEPIYKKHLVSDLINAGIWSPVLRQVDHDDSRPVTHHFVTLDPDFHADPVIPGTVLSDAPGPLPVQAVAIDTTTLANGVHRLYQRASCQATDLGGGTNEGVVVFPFIVNNP